MEGYGREECSRGKVWYLLVGYGRKVYGREWYGWEGIVG